MATQTYYSNGKLLLTGEYLVLDGALALGIPTQYGQSLVVEPYKNGLIKWYSYDDRGELWFETELARNVIQPSKPLATDQSIEARLIQILSAAIHLNPYFLNPSEGFKIKTFLNFPQNWGLGTSSTLINNIAQWAALDPYQLLDATFGGSGYDIACANHNKPVTYQLQGGTRRVVTHDFDPDFKDHLYFVFLNKKQNSREGIAAYKKHAKPIESAISEISTISSQMLQCSNLETFQFLMERHEHLIAKIIKQKPVKELYFKDFNGSIKSLGAWGGDFIMAATKDDPQTYFKSKGFNTLIPYREMVLYK